jgi:hypothetical protein
VTLTPLFKEMLNAVNAILESLAVQADIVSGVPRQMLGVIEQRDAVVKVGINQVYFPWRCLEILTGVLTAVQETLDNFKWAYRNKPKQGILLWCLLFIVSLNFL